VVALEKKNPIVGFEAGIVEVVAVAVEKEASLMNL
jgi:hypothetical protein